MNTCVLFDLQNPVGFKTVQMSIDMWGCSTLKKKVFKIFIVMQIVVYHNFLLTRVKQNFRGYVM